MVPSTRRSKTRFRVAEIVPTSGLYRAFHSIDGFSHEVTLVLNDAFPPCTKCGDQIYFKFVRESPEIDSDYDFRIRLFQIPHPVAEAMTKKETA